MSDITLPPSSHFRVLLNDGESITYLANGIIIDQQGLIPILTVIGGIPARTIAQHIDWSHWRMLDPIEVFEVKDA